MIVTTLGDLMSTHLSSLHQPCMFTRELDVDLEASASTRTSMGKRLVVLYG